MAARKTLFACLFATASALAQVADFAPPAAPAPAAAPAGGPNPVGQPAPAPASAQPKTNNSPFGQEVPVFDPGTEVLTFNGKNWNVTNNRIFQARFEKFLNAPEAVSTEEQQYRQIMERMLD